MKFISQNVWLVISLELFYSLITISITFSISSLSIQPFYLLHCLEHQYYNSLFNENLILDPRPKTLNIRTWMYYFCNKVWHYQHFRHILFYSCLDHPLCIVYLCIYEWQNVCLFFSSIHPSIHSSMHLSIYLSNHFISFIDISLVMSFN